MNKELDEIIRVYATKDHKAVSNLLLGRSKNAVAASLIDLLTIYFNDKNSSALREYILVTLSDFTPNEEKIGYNGYRQSGIGGGTVHCEAKPKNINTNDGKNTKLNGGGNFTDYTFGRFRKNKRDNPLMIVGGFIDGKLLYIFRFPFRSKSFTDALNAKLLKRFPNGKDIPNEFLRSATFSLGDYKNIRGLETEVFVSSTELKKYKKHITAPLFSLLLKEL